MALAKDERDRVLALIEAGKISAGDAARLLDTLESESQSSSRATDARRERVIRIVIRTINQKHQSQRYTIGLPLSILQASLRLGGYLLPQLNSELITTTIMAAAGRPSGRILDIQDLERDERIEIFIE